MTQLPILTQIEARILGCLLEKKEATPDVYPLTFLSLKAAVNQKTSRDPVMSLEDAEINHAIKLLEQKELVRRAFASRADRFEHRLGHKYNLLQPQAVLLALLLLRGPQTAYELMARSERMAIFGSINYLREQLDLLITQSPSLVAITEPLYGQREERFAHLFCGEVARKPAVAPAPAPVVRLVPPAPVLAPSTTVINVSALEKRVQQLEREVAALRAHLEARSA
ncbi:MULTISPECIES: DUF480 domain-containing protein [Mesorhizobium]|uniref:DUF480 domain-containing protein n=1 Tax=Mesorhizobium denitrificans TaxID=2294114 RepID=A0A371XGK4_9HYPH|nr:MULTISPECIES: DUF480 domain-containing protein [Mesorhizobium]RFC68365.1 DUF480 domain-containing protein [Mesorhizobium denitrificans]